MKKEIKQVEKKINKINQDQYRLNYHLMPPVGSLADPNGMIKFKDTYHIYYIYNPLSSITDERTACAWGHYSTKDFINYKKEKIAIYPDSQNDCDGVYSGCSFIEDNLIHVYYTGNVRHAGNHDYITTGREQNVIYTFSKDGINFEKKKLIMTNNDFPKNMSLHVRDPKVYKENDKYYMLLGARSLDDEGSVLLFESLDKYNWKYVNNIKTKDKFGYMWECPDIITLENHKYLVACPQGVEQVGHLYQNSHQCGYFEIMEDYKLSDFKQFDYGFDFYAARTFIDGSSIILIGWLGMPECSYTKNLTKNKGWQQALSLPRKLSFRNNHIYQQPISRLKQLRNNELVLSFTCDKIELNKLSFELKIDLNKNQDIYIQLREDCIIEYNIKSKIFQLTMNQCGDGRKKRTLSLETLENITIFSDTSSLEMFINDGFATMSSRIFGNSDRLAINKFDGNGIIYDIDEFKVEW